LKVPQSKFWCPGCNSAAEKFWRRHCLTGHLVGPTRRPVRSFSAALWAYERH